MINHNKQSNRRLSISELTQLLDNASATYQRQNINRTQLIELKKRYQCLGFESFKDLPVIRRSHPRKTPKAVAEKIISLSLEHPGWGCVRLADELKSFNINISSPTIQKILIKNEMGNKNERLFKLEEKVLNEQFNLSKEQIVLMEKVNPCFRERAHESSRPGETLVQDALMIGILKNVGKVYLQSIVDTYSSYAFGFLHIGKSPDCAVAILHNDVIPFYKKLGVRIQTIITNNGREYCGTENHHFELYLILNELRHQRIKLREHIINGFIERFNRIVLDEFFKKIFHKKNYTDLETLQKDFDQWLFYYNNERPHKGYRNLGKTPAQVMTEYFNSVMISNVE